MREIDRLTFMDTRTTISRKGKVGMAKQGMVPKLDLKRFQDREYSHTEAVRATGLTEDRLQIWYKRGVLVEFTERPKQRGIRRKYSLLDLMYLTALREIAAAGVPLVCAAMDATVAAWAMFAGWQMQYVRRRYKQLLVIHWSPEGTPGQPSPVEEQHGEMVPLCQYFDDWGKSPLPRGGLAAWMSAQGICRAHVINLAWLLIEFQARLTDVLRARQEKTTRRQQTSGAAP